MALETVRQAVRPFLVGVKHLFMKPYTVKYPYERAPTLPGENYRYDPKAGIAYPGYKGRHVLYMDKCTGCSLCDIACQNIAEAITMVYAYDILLQLDEKAYNAFKSGDAVLAEAIGDLLLSIQESNKEAYKKRGVSHPLMVILPDLKQLSKRDGVYEVRVNIDAVWERRSDLLVARYLEGGFRLMETKGWSISRIEDKAPDLEVYEASKDGVRVKVIIQKQDFKNPRNKKSYFPQVDYGRCVFCGFCVDACPFYALEMGPDVELSALSRVGLVYNPLALSEKVRVTTPPPTINPIDSAYGWLRSKLR